MEGKQCAGTDGFGCGQVCGGGGIANMGSGNGVFVWRSYGQPFLLLCGIGVGALSIWKGGLPRCDDDDYEGKSYIPISGLAGGVGH